MTLDVVPTVGNEVKCSFCGKPRGTVRGWLPGLGTFICTECVELCEEILDATPEESEPT